MCDISAHCIVVYETSSQFVTYIGRYGHEEGQFDSPSYHLLCLWFSICVRCKQQSSDILGCQFHAKEVYVVYGVKAKLSSKL